MTRIEESIEIKRPVSQVFAFAMDVNAWPQWDPQMLEVEQTSIGPMGVGTTFRGTVRAMGQRQEWTGIVTEYEPNRKWAHSITSGNVLIDEHLIFDPIKGGTRFTQIYDVQSSGFPEQVAAMLTAGMRTEMNERLRLFKSILQAQPESGSAT
jgi:uncharacterized protein YndB with AHSA1/START domain